MTRVILDIPTEKMHSFIKAILNLGIERHAIPSKKMNHPFSREKVNKLLKRISSSYILFDWEFFSSELEYE